MTPGRLTQLERTAYRKLLRPLLFRMWGGNPERVHETTLRVLSRIPPTREPRRSSPVEVAGIRFPNRVGLAAGMDKDGTAAGAWGRLGFGFAELGTVTGQPQPGNQKPRVFRLPGSRALINRMGFNNRGAAALAATLEAGGVRRGNNAMGIPLGISIGKSRVVGLDHALDDYLVSLRHVARHADYVAINVSSPNTPGLRTLQGAEEIATLIGALVQEARSIDTDPVPIFVKLAPDLDPRAVAESVAVAQDNGAAGFIATNTTLRRDGIVAGERRLGEEAGGLSGAPLTVRALRFVEELCSLSTLPVMGAGGIMTPADAARMFDAGAALVQLYTGFIYEGPALVRGIHELGEAT